MEVKYLSMAEASRVCPYEQGYLSLLARRGELQAEKKGRNWYTTVDWLNEYIVKKKPHAKLIKHSFFSGESNQKENIFSKANWILFISISVIIIVGFFLFGKVYNFFNKVESKSNQFIPEEIVKIPDEQGNFDVYSRGTIKIGKEKQELK